MKKLYLLILLFVSATIYAQPGKLDSSFSNDGKVITDFEGLTHIEGITLQKNGKIIVAGGGSLGEYFSLARYNKNGSIDKSFGNNGKVISQQEEHPVFTGVALQSDEKIIAVGTANLRGYYKQVVIYRFTAKGILDSSFGDNGFAFLTPRDIDSRSPAVAIQTDDKIVITGAVNANDANQESFAARLTAHGKRDSVFFKNGIHLISLGKISFFYAVAIQANGKIVVAGSGGETNKSTIALVRFETNGELDKNFGNGGKLLAPGNVFVQGTDVKIYPNGKIIVSGSIIANDKQNMILLRVKTDGTIDSLFGINGRAIINFENSSYASSLALQADGKIIVAGSADTNKSGSKKAFALARLKPNGKLDNSFGNNGRVITDFLPDNGFAAAVIIQPDGNIIAAGETTNENFFNLAMARYIGDKTTSFTQQQNQTKESFVKIYPNPVKDVLVIENLHSSKTMLSITDRAGNIIKKTSSSEKIFYWNISDLKAGEYYLTIQNTAAKTSILFLKD